MDHGVREGWKSRWEMGRGLREVDSGRHMFRWRAGFGIGCHDRKREKKGL